MINAQTQARLKELGKYYEKRGKLNLAMKSNHLLASLLMPDHQASPAETVRRMGDLMFALYQYAGFLGAEEAIEDQILEQIDSAEERAKVEIEKLKAKANGG